MRIRAAGIHDNTLSQPVRIPRLHGSSLVRDAEVGEDRVAGADVLEVAFDDLGLVAFGSSAEVPAERIDRLPAGLANQSPRPPAGGGGPARYTRTPPRVRGWRPSTARPSSSLSAMPAPSTTRGSRPFPIQASHGSR